MGRDGIFLGRDCHFFRTSWYFHKIGTRWYFLGRDCPFLGRVGNLITWYELVTFLGRDGHRLTKLANLKYWGDAFCNYWGGWGPIIGGGYIPPIPPPPRFGTADCDIIFHTKCAKKAKFKLFRNKQYCLSCITTNDIIRYNPFHDLLENQDDKFLENEPTEYIQIIQELSETLENCKSYSKSQFNELMANNLNQKHKGQGQNLLFFIYFLNIDGK